MSPRRAATASFLLVAGLCFGAPVLPVAAATPVRVGVACATHPHEPVPLVHRLSDTPRVTEAGLSAVPDQPKAAANTPFLARMAIAPRLPGRVNVPVYVHVIKGTHRGERSPAGPKRVKRMLRVLNRGFHGKESKANTRTRYTFVLRKIDYTRREGWYHAFLYGPRDDRMRKTLHRGGKGTLNIYINGGGPKGEPVLGWTTFPWQQHKHPRLDGVTVNWRAMPWGTLKRYHQGDTVIHETGHWMGLFHTFQGGCGRRGDMVADTPAEAEPSYACNTHRDTCKDQAGRDPVHNFMDYSWDTCMNQFTPDQVDRMDRSFAKYRR